MFWRRNPLFPLPVLRVSPLTSTCVANHRGEKWRLLFLGLSSRFSLWSTPTYTHRSSETSNIARVGIIIGLVATIAAVSFVPPDQLVTDDGCSGVPAFALARAGFANSTPSVLRKRIPYTQDIVGASSLPLTYWRTVGSNAPIHDCVSILGSSCSLRC
jgi:hypothetical protein